MARVIVTDENQIVVIRENGIRVVRVASIAVLPGDHGALAGLGDDDHIQYLNEARHDALAADNPHSVTFSQAVAADAGTDITAAEAETLTDGSNADLLHVHAPIVGADHGLLAGLGDDDHPQYAQIAAIETISAVWTFSVHPAGLDHVSLANIGVNTHAAIDTHIADGTVHFTEGSIDHTAILNIGTNSHVAIDSHIADGTIHFTEASIDHTAITNIGVNSHAAIDTHIADGTIHFTEASINHANILGIGTNTHAQIDTHIADATIHFTEASIDHTAILNIGTNSHAVIDSHIASVANPHSVTKTQVGLGNVTDDAQLKRAAADFATFTTKATPVAADVILIEDSAALGAKKKITVGDITSIDATTASNVNVGGVGVFKQKLLNNLEFRGINAASSKISVALDAVNNEIDVDVVEANIIHQNLSGAGTNTHAQIDTHIADATIHFTVASIDHGAIAGLADDDHPQYTQHATVETITGVWAFTAHPTGLDHASIANIGTNTHAQIDTHIADATIHFTEASINHANIVGVGTNTHAQIDTHIASVLNPHSVTFTQAVTADAGTDITAAEAETLTDGSNADLLHTHTDIGENNTASNVNVGGVGVFKQKTGVDLEFRGVNAASSKISVALDAINNEIDIDVVEANVIHQNLSGAGTNTHAQIDTHIADASIHFTVASIDHGAIAGLADDDHPQYTQHATVETITGIWAFTAHPTGLDHVSIANIGTNTHAQIDTHIADGTIHFTEASINHANILGVGTNTHAQIDTHIADATIHFTEASIDHTAILNIGTNTHAQIDTHIASVLNPHSVTFTQAVTADAGTDITAAEAETLTDGSNADLLHVHAGGGGGTIQLSWKFSTTLTAADPGSTRFRYNSATPASVTEIYVDDIALSGVDAGFILGNLNPGDEIYIQQIDDSTRFLLAKIVTAVDNTGWWTLTVTIDDSGTLPANNADCGFILFFNTTGVASDQAVAQASLSTTQAFTTAWVDVGLNTTDFENNTSIVDHDAVTNDRILLKELGPYMISYGVDADVTPLANSHAQVGARVQVNDAGGALSGSFCESDALEDSSLLGDATVSPTLVRTFVYNNTNVSNWISLQIQRIDTDAGIDVDAARVHMKAVRLTGEKGSQGAAGSGGSVFRTPQTYAIAGEIKVPVGQTDFIPPFYVSLAAGHTAKLVKVRHRINAGTSATVKLQKNGVDVTGFTGISVTTTDTDTDPADVTLADNDKLALVVTGVSGTPQNMSFTVFIEHTG